MRRLILAALGFPLAVATPTIAQTGVEPVPYPEGYRLWTHVNSMVLFENHALAEQFGGLHHVYANELALEGLQNGSYADGAVFVFDLLEAQRSDDALTQGARKRVDVMHRNASRYASTGGWGFDTFAANSRSERLVTDGGVSCYECHTQQAEKSFVFSHWSP